MKNQLLDKILTLLEGIEKVEFTKFYEKSLHDADTTARTEERLSLYIQAATHAHQHNLPLPEIQNTIHLLKFLAFGDKPDE